MISKEEDHVHKNHAMIREAEAFTVMMKHFMLACYIPASLIRIKCIDCMFALTLWDFILESLLY